MDTDTFFAGHSKLSSGTKRILPLPGGLLLFCLIMLLAVSCEKRKLGYGIVLWSVDQQVIPGGSLVPVYKSSEFAKTYTIGIGTGNETLLTDMWRIRFFKTRKDAESFLEEYEPYINTFARSNTTALPVRDQPAPDAARIYGLRDKEILKIIGRTTDQEVTVGNLKGYWYRVLTESGTEGFTFSRMLTVYDMVQGLPDSTEPFIAADNNIELFLSSIWRPEYYVQMIESGRYDLSTFTPSYGIFPDPEMKSVKVVTSNYEAVFPFSEITRVSAKKYSFDLSSFTFTINDNFISVQYSYNGQEYSGAFARVGRDIETIISDELTRRKRLFDEFISKSSVFESSAYGRVTIKNDQTFRWTGFDRLTPGIIPSSAGQDGFIEFKLGLDSKVSSVYDGVISFNFTGTGNTRSVNFLYDSMESGVRFVYIPESDIKRMIVLREASSPTVIFFSYGS